MSAPDVALLHAFPLDHRMWAPVSQQLSAAGHNVVALDLPGFGTSELPSAAPSLAAVANAVVAELDRRGIGDIVVCGASLGGYVAMAILRSRPELVSALALCGTKATGDNSEALKNRRRIARLVTEAPESSGRVLEPMLPGLLGETSMTERPQVVSLVRGWLHEASPTTVAWYQNAMAVRPDSRAVLAAYDGPALVVWGNEDTVSPAAEQDLMLDSLAHADLRVVDRAGHLACIEEPEIVADAIRSFAGVVGG